LVIGNIVTKQAFGIERPPRVHIYSEAMAPEPNTHGAGLVICSQVQAFLDLGCEVEFVFIQTRNNTPPSPAYFKEIKCTVVDARREHPFRYARLAYWAGRPRKLAWQQLYPARNMLLREVKARMLQDDTAIHVFNYLRTANVIPSLPRARTIGACHEIETEYYAHNYAVDQEREKRQPYGYETRLIRRLSELEREVARSSGLVLCVASDDAKRMIEEWSVPHAAYLPFSIPYGERTIVSGEGRKPGELRMMHIGALDHLPSYTSLEFLFTRVFPLLGANTLSRLQLEVVGSSVPNGARTKAIMEMARPYPMVRFSGFVDNIRTAYRRNDLQVVASTQATGVRTRIIESWAYGMPVLSTTVGAGGVKDIAPGRNIFIADDPRDFARTLQELIHAPERLDEIARAARQTYEAKCGRRVVAAALRELLNTHFGLRLTSTDRAIPSSLLYR
jgi:glycosyltransferase involved in cell wall biosynthesis